MQEMTDITTYKNSQTQRDILSFLQLAKLSSVNFLKDWPCLSSLKNAYPTGWMARQTWIFQLQHLGGNLPKYRNYNSLHLNSIGPCFLEFPLIKDLQTIWCNLTLPLFGWAYPCGELPLWWCRNSNLNVLQDRTRRIFSSTQFQEFPAM